MKHDLPIDPGLLPALAAFECVARHASFTRAAEQMGISASALSQTMRGLETRLGVRLLARTTRRVGLTEEGARILDGVRRGLSELGSAIGSLEETRAQPSGTVRVTMPGGAYGVLFAPHMPSFAARYPGIGVEFSLDNNLTDIIANGFDAGLRLISSIEADMISVPIGAPQRLVVVASPAYFSRHPIPATPDDLAVGHECSHFRHSSSGRLAGWTFLRDGRAQDVALAVRFVLNDLDAEIELARRGVAIVQTVESMVLDDIRNGRLTPVLDAYALPLPAFHLYFPSRVQMPLRLRAFIDHFHDANAAPAEKHHHPRSEDRISEHVSTSSKAAPPNV